MKKSIIASLFVLLLIVSIVYAQNPFGAEPATLPPPPDFSVEEKTVTDEQGNVKKEFAVTATCTDKIQNQGEEGIDCGGPCPYACEKPKSKSSLWIWLTIGGIIILTIIIILILKSRKGQIPQQQYPMQRTQTQQYQGYRR